MRRPRPLPLACTDVSARRPQAARTPAGSTGGRRTAVMPAVAARHDAVQPMWSSEWAAFVWSSVPGLLLATAAATGLVPEWLALGLFAVSFVALNLMHMGATWARV